MQESTVQIREGNFADKINLCAQFLQVLSSFFTICCSIRFVLLHSLIIIVPRC